MKPRSMVILWLLSMVVIFAVGLSVSKSEKPSEAAAPSPTPSSPVATSSAPTTSPTTAPTSQSTSAACAPSGTSLSITAHNVAFDTNCLAAPADKTFTIAFTNQDSGVPHNVSIVDSSGKALFTGSIFPGVATETYKVGALSAGTYTFKCDVHPTQMTGTFVVK